jgi:hypothetical protein
MEELYTQCHDIAHRIFPYNKVMAIDLELSLQLLVLEAYFKGGRDVKNLTIKND